MSHKCHRELNYRGKENISARWNCNYGIFSFPFRFSFSFFSCHPFFHSFVDNFFPYKTLYKVTNKRVIWTKRRTRRIHYLIVGNYSMIRKRCFSTSKVFLWSIFNWNVGVMEHASSSVVLIVADKVALFVWLVWVIVNVEGLRRNVRDTNVIGHGRTNSRRKNWLKTNVKAKAIKDVYQGYPARKGLLVVSTTDTREAIIK